jgi:hypothetical protein
MLLLLVSVLGGKNVLSEAGLFLEKWRAAASVLGNEEEFVGLPQNGGYNLANLSLEFSCERLN